MGGELIKFQREKFNSELLKELMPLLIEHYKEIAVYQDIPLSVKDGIYEHLEENGALRVFTARRSDQNLVGYCVFIVTNNIHYSTCLEAKNDVIYIDKKCRGFGSSFISWCDSELNKENVQIVYHHIKPDHDWSAIIKRKGYIKFETIYAKRLSGGK